MRLLAVDDNTELLALLAESFSDAGYVVDLAYDGKQAVRAFEQARPDVVLLDLALPGLRGPDVLTEMQRIDPSVPVVIMTGFDDRRLAESLLELGAVEYIVKPCDLSRLHAAVAAALARRRARHPA
jgi:DNA-binding response OmpR family regulator